MRKRAYLANLLKFSFVYIAKSSLVITCTFKLWYQLITIFYNINICKHIRKATGEQF